MTRDPIYWDNKLLMPHALAPKHIRGGLDDKTYRNEGRKLAEYRTRMIVERALPELIRKNPKRGGVNFLGIGLANRGLQCVGPIIKAGFAVSMYDMSGVACQNARRLFEHMSWFNLSYITPAEIMTGWNSGLIDEKETLAYIAFQFIQIQDRKTMRQMMRHLGSFLSGNGVLYLDHPLGDDKVNQDPRKWGDTIPYTMADLRKPVEEGIGGVAQMHVIGHHMYFGQKYSFVKIQRR